MQGQNPGPLLDHIVKYTYVDFKSRSFTTDFDQGLAKPTTV
jgi:hypothetical protein